MQINPNFINNYPAFSSPLRFIDQNMSVRTHASPNCPQKFSLSAAHRLKQRFTHVSDSQKSQSHLVRSIKISYK